MGTPADAPGHQLLTELQIAKRLLTLDVALGDSPAARARQDP
jgi:hypothetical protein